MDRSVTRKDINPLFFLGAIFRSALTFPRCALGVAGRIAVNQIRFTGVQALPILIITAIAFGIPLLLTVVPLSSGLGVEEAVDRILVTLVVQEMGPLVAALLVVVRSGTAVVAELSTARVTGARGQISLSMRYFSSRTPEVLASAAASLSASSVTAVLLRSISHIATL